MSGFRTFEVRALRLLAGDELPASLLDLIVSAELPLKYDYTGQGYLLTVSHPELPEERGTLSHPCVMGNYRSTTCSFVAFLGDRELTLECCALGTEAIPANFRDLPVKITAEELLP